MARRVSLAELVRETHEEEINDKKPELKIVPRNNYFWEKHKEDFLNIKDF